MCRICSFLSCSSFRSKLQKSLEEEKRMLNNSFASGDAVLFRSRDVPDLLSVDRPLFEVRVAQPSPIKYFQDMFVDEERWPIVWRHNSFRTVTVLPDGRLLLLSKHPDPGERSYTHYLELVIDKHEYNISLSGASSEGFIRISFDGYVELLNIKTENVERHRIEFVFVSHPFHYVSKSEARTALRRQSSHYLGSAAMSKFEDYVVTVPFFSLHPFILNDYERCGFKKRVDMQAIGPSFFFNHSHEFE